MFQRLEKMKKNAFASAILFGENNNSSISGVKYSLLHALPLRSFRQLNDEKKSLNPAEYLIILDCQVSGCGRVRNLHSTSVRTGKKSPLCGAGAWLFSVVI